MLEAKSMYFGGEIISASDCNYQTSRELGLVCPFCNCAVFIRSESVRQQKGKLQLVRPYFAHYPSGSEQNWDCDKRSHTRQGREYIEKLKIQTRNQRLRLYNSHLWNMFADSHGIKPQHLNRVRSLLGERWCEQNSILVRHEWRNALNDVYTFIDEALLGIEAKIEDSNHYLLNCDLRLHQAICVEVADFLASDTAGFVFAKVFKLSLREMLEFGGKDWGLKETKAVRPIAHISSISILIAATKWIDQIRERLSK